MIIVMVQSKTKQASCIVGESSLHKVPIEEVPNLIEVLVELGPSPISNGRNS